MISLTQAFILEWDGEQAFKERKILVAVVCLCYCIHLSVLIMLLNQYHRIFSTSFINLLVQSFLPCSSF
jgi:hypothetical protein